MSSAGRGPDVVHGLWIGSTLSRLELLTLRSFTRMGHPFVLWVYDELQTPVPVGVSLRDANQILPRSRIFKKAAADLETGVGQDAYPPFSDLFRYKLLYEHGGVWADMDVTCLRPLDFKEDYVFRPHRIGMVGNLMKVPRGSELMRATFEEVDAVADEHVAWLTPNRILNKHVERLGLSGFIRRDISNTDDWLDVVRPFIEGPEPIPDPWCVLHWVSEFWRTLETTGGVYRGRKVVDHVPDRNAPPAGGTLWELYRVHGLLDPWERPTAPPAAKAAPPPRRPLLEPGAHAAAQPWRLNVLAPALVRGGAERTILETLQALQSCDGASQSLHILQRSQRQYPILHGAQASVRFLADGPDQDPMRRVAFDVLASPTPVLFTHLIGLHHLERLWRLGVTTVPVVHNSRPGWLDPPTAYNCPAVPFVIACADAVADQLRQSGCEKPVITVRHELQRWFDPAALAAGRRAVRDRHGVGDDALLVGMVGQFKSQKAYTRAVRVLAQLREVCKARLMILGGWDHAYGSGRTAYEAACRLAVELGVIADMIMPGDVESVDPYLGAFDVFLNTSVYEGLSISLLEAIRAGCPVVAADVGGAREIAAEGVVLIDDPSDIDAYVDAIVALARQRERVVPVRPAQEPDLVPRLWGLLARHGAGPAVARPAPPSGTLFVTANLHVGGPARALVNLLTRLPKDEKNALCLLGGASAAGWSRALEAAEVAVLSLEDAAGTVGRVEQILARFEALNFRTLCLWSIPPEVKLLLAKTLAARDVRLVDVSPGPMLFDELEAARPFQARIAYTGRQYLERLDTFVALYEAGRPDPELHGTPRRTVVIPRGVPAPPRFVPLPPPEAMPPRRFDPELAIGTCTRVVPDKRIEFLLDMMTAMRTRAPAASLTIVGGPDGQSLDYWEDLLRRIRDAHLDHVHLAGRHDDVDPFLARFKVFVMVSDRQGSPNASLEAMAMGLPVVANPSGGTAEQIADGMNGFLVDTPEEMAERVARLLTDPCLRERMGQRARRTALERFSIDRMVRSYRDLLSEG